MRTETKMQMSLQFSSDLPVEDWQMTPAEYILRQDKIGFGTFSQMTFEEAAQFVRQCYEWPNSSPEYAVEKLETELAHCVSCHAYEVYKALEEGLPVPQRVCDCYKGQAAILTALQNGVACEALAPFALASLPSWQP